MSKLTATTRFSIFKIIILPLLIGFSLAHATTSSENGVIVVEGKTIKSIGKSLDIPTNAKIIDLGDATLLPGFIDAHVHFDGEMSGDWYKDFYNGIMRFPAERALYAAQKAKVTLESGVTTVRDVGSSDYIALGLRNAINAGIVPGPRMVVSNYAVGATGGHADQDPVPPQTIAVANSIKVFAMAQINVAKPCAIRLNLEPMSSNLCLQVAFCPYPIR